MKLLGPLLLLAVLGGAAANGSRPGRLPTVFFERAGCELSALPGASVLNPRGLVRDVAIDMIPATVMGPRAAPISMLAFNAMLYASRRGTFLFGPTIRVRAGDTIHIHLSNRLPPANPLRHPTVGDTGFHDPTHTNLHIHGLHESPGLFAQTVPVRYRGGDNVLVQVPPGGQLYWESRVPRDHLPGMHWVHPHKHGSTTVQTFTANALVIIEDDPKWLPDINGCAHVRTLLWNAREVIIHFELLTFAPPNPFNDTATADWYAFIGTQNATLDDTNYQNASSYSAPQNPLYNPATGHGVHGSAKDKDVLLVNGAWQPKLGMQAGVWQRWRLVHTGYKRFLDLQIVDQAGELVPDCELMLIAHDGIYVRQLPRPVPHIFLAAGSRGELFVRCARPGRYTLTAGRKPSPFGPGFGSLSWFVQPVVLTLEVAPARPPRTLIETWLSAPILPRGCAPLFPSYAADLSDAALVRAGATGKLIKQNVGFTFGNQTYGCLVNDRNFTYPDPTPIRMPLGSVWAFSNTAEHPLHLHTNPFQIMELPPSFLKPGNVYTSWFEAGDTIDSLQLPMIGNPNATNLVRLRIQPGPFTGYAVLHCHMLQHEDQGCMAMVRWECPGFTDVQPQACPGFQFPVPGTFKGV